jgi:hypothetical protein
MLVAVAAGLMFARFSRPTARVVFSKVAVVGPFNGVPTLSLRLANERRNQILEAQVSLTLARDEQTRLHANQRDRRSRPSRCRETARRRRRRRSDKMAFLAEKGCVSWDISAAPRRSGREYYGNEPK